MKSPVNPVLGDHTTMKKLIPTIIFLGALAVVGLEAARFTGSSDEAAKVISVGSGQAVPPPCYPLPNCPVNKDKKAKPVKK